MNLELYIQYILGKVNVKREDFPKAQEQFSLTDQSTSIGTLLDGTDYKILQDSGSYQEFYVKIVLSQKLLLA